MTSPRTFLPFVYVAPGLNPGHHECEAAYRHQERSQSTGWLPPGPYAYPDFPESELGRPNFLTSRLAGPRCEPELGVDKGGDHRLPPVVCREGQRTGCKSRSKGKTSGYAASWWRKIFLEQSPLTPLSSRLLCREFILSAYAFRQFSEE